MYIKPKKSLGQNFLIDSNIQRKIIKACALSKEDIVLEIGAGKGYLSGQFAKAARQVYALEIDPRLYPSLDQTLCAYDNCQIIKADILKFNINKFAQENAITQKIKVIGNIPYYISSPIIEQLIRYRNNISAVFLTVQKEFGRRIVAAPGPKEFGSFSCFTRYYAECKILFEISRNCFAPRPKVDSCFLSMKFREEPAVRVDDEVMFFKLIRTAFNQRRKTLRNSLDGLVTKEDLDRFLDSSGIQRNIRPESLSLEQFAGLAKIIKNNQNNQKIA